MPASGTDRTCRHRTLPAWPVQWRHGRRMADKVSNRIPEWSLQASIAADLERRIAEGAPFAFACGLEGVRLNHYQAKLAKAMGMQSGEPDLRLYFANARLVFIELKGDGGSLSADQKERIPILRGLGFIVHVVKAKTHEEAVAAVGAIVEREMQWPGASHSMDTATYFPKERKKAA
jgi:hypothetical protein